MSKWGFCDGFCPPLYEDVYPLTEFLEMAEMPRDGLLTS
jgi:hypothetical protein